MSTRASGDGSGCRPEQGDEDALADKPVMRCDDDDGVDDEGDDDGKGDDGDDACLNLGALKLCAYVAYISYAVGRSLNVIAKSVCPKLGLIARQMMLNLGEGQLQN